MKREENEERNGNQRRAMTSHHSLSIAVTIKSTTQQKRSLTLTEEDDFRTNYLSIIQKPQWRDELISIAENLKETILFEDANPMEEISFCIKLGQGDATSYKEFPVPTSPCITVGRMEHTDLGTGYDVTLSRLHVVFFPLASLGKTIICDVGSLSGIKMVERSGNSECVSSLPQNRTVIVTEYGETCIFQLGDVEMVVAPKECIICMERPRGIYFEPCNHFICCEVCASKVIKCPICNKNIQKKDHRNHCYSMVTNTQVRRQKY